MVMDQQVYNHKMRYLIAKHTYTKLSRDSTKRTEAIAKHLVRLISPLAGQTKSYVKNSTDFASKISLRTP